MNKTEKMIDNIRSISSRLLITEAVQRGISAKHLNPYKGGPSFLELEYKGHREFMCGQSSSLTNYAGFFIQKDKALTKEYLKRAGINVSPGAVFRKDEIDKALEFAKKIGYPVVVKPHDGGHGRDVIVGIKNKRELELKLATFFKKEEIVLLERMFSGTEYRIVATRTKFLAVANRVPANITGDGKSTIKELIQVKNSDPRRGDLKRTFLKEIHIDKEVRRTLEMKRLSLNSIPKAGRVIYLRNNSNLSTGGDSFDDTDKLHPEFKKIAVRAVRAIPGLAYGGVDLMTNKDISKKPTKGSYIIMEINASPGISMHHGPYEGKKRDVASGIIDIIFPETKKKK